MTVVDLVDATNERRFGGKAAELGAARRAGLPVPDGIAIAHERLAALADDGEAAARLVELVADVDGPYVVRSSGVAEDSEAASFAGQHRTVLNVPEPADVVDALEAVHTSARSDAVAEYRSKMGIEAPPRMAAVVQTLVDAETSGVLFTRNPVDGTAERVIEAAWGLGEAVVDSMVTPDYFRVEPGGAVLERRAGTKDVRVVPASGGGTETEPVSAERREQLCLNESELRELDALADRCEAYRAGGHDIEWAFADSELFLLQRRAITTG